MQTAAPARLLDTAVFDLIAQEKTRQTHGLELIASENYVSEQVMAAQGSVLTNKYAVACPASATMAAAKSWTRSSSWPSTA